MNAWHSILRPVIGFILLFGVILVGIESPASGQGTGQGNFTPNTGVTIQLPSISTFGVQTVVSVPDGGTMLLGGNSGFAAGRSSRGVPGLSSIPFLNRPFRNQGIGYNTSSSNAFRHDTDHYPRGNGNGRYEGGSGPGRLPTKERPQRNC